MLAVNACPIPCNLNDIWPQGYKTFSCSTQLSMKFQLLMKTKIPTNEDVSPIRLKYCIHHAYKCQNATIVAI